MAVLLLSCLLDLKERAEKSWMGQVIDTMLAVVRHKLDISLSDFVLVTAWRVMWDLTNEASRNSQWFRQGSKRAQKSECLGKKFKPRRTLEPWNFENYRVAG